MNAPVMPQASGSQVTLEHYVPVPPSPTEFVFSLDTGEPVLQEPLKRVEKSATPRKKGKVKSKSANTPDAGRSLVVVREGSGTRALSDDAQTTDIAKPVEKRKARPRPAYIMRDSFFDGFLMKARFVVPALESS